MTEEKILRCGDCRACCQQPNLVVGFRVDEDPDLYRTKKRIPGKPIDMAKSSSGACVYLEPHGCGIYEKRPHACSNFDCREFAKRNFSDITPDNPTFAQIEEIKAAARAATMRAKCSCARRFNDMLRG